MFKASASNTLPLTIENVSGEQPIADKWENKYRRLLNSTDESLSNLVHFHLSNESNPNDLRKYFTNADIVNSLIPKLQQNRSAGFDGMSAEHLIYAHRVLAVYLSILFNVCLLHGCMPQNCLNTLLIPIRKSAMKEVRDSYNYRPIALATVISKLFERVILNSTSTMLSTCDNQFGFKVNHGTDMCVFVLKQVVNYCVNHGSPIFSVFIDSSKAFDKVSHNILFEKLIERNIPSCFVRLLWFWYSHQQMIVKWSNCFSSFTVSNGVRQGGISSPYMGECIWNVC